MLKTPIAFLIFRRPDLTAKVFEAIRQVQPRQLFIVADGARNEAEDILCQQARAVTEVINWDCEVFRNYSDKNLGCRKRVSSGLDWVFSQVEEAIILEDDCLPHLSFFDYCQNLLEYYREDQRIMGISGNNFQDGKHRNEYSYYFSKYSHCWGWATWRRAWKYWDCSPAKWIEFRKMGLLRIICEDSYEHKYWEMIFDEIFLKGKPDTWDYIWTFTCWSQGGLTILPNVNLVSNIGFGKDATHTHKESHFANMKPNEIISIKHPPFMISNLEADNYTYRKHYASKFQLIKKLIKSKLKK